MGSIPSSLLSESTFLDPFSVGINTLRTRKQGGESISGKSGLERDATGARDNSRCARIEERRDKDRGGREQGVENESYGKFWRQFRLPENADVDTLKPKLENGVLTISFAKLSPDRTKGHKVVDIDTNELEGKDSSAYVLAPNSIFYRPIIGCPQNHNFSCQGSRGFRCWVAVETAGDNPSAETHPTNDSKVPTEIIPEDVLLRYFGSVDIASLLASPIGIHRDRVSADTQAFTEASSAVVVEPLLGAEREVLAGAGADEVVAIVAAEREREIAGNYEDIELVPIIIHYHKSEEAGKDCDSSEEEQSGKPVSSEYGSEELEVYKKQMKLYMNEMIS
ncbi:hypothetical protein RND71_039522 [Anisodus tanguticus]|uniref:SHSP domain-containing protein n=1 Tax=Anisodus tanguticus TaxID=243964 RepID=A0AAE1UVF0_9SOLA|nr:hypothetical protein RND71_039522 [Anisodus tanguticus]